MRLNTPRRMAVAAAATLFFMLPAQAIAAPPNPETETWEAATSVNSVAAYEAYLKAYPKGRYTAAARIRLEGLKSASVPKAASTSAAAAPPATSAPAEARPAEPMPAAATRIPVEPASWQTLAQSPQYQSAPQVKAVTVTWASQSGMGANAPAVNYDVQLKIEPEGAHCARITRKTDWTMPTGKTSSQHTVDVTCGMVALGTIANGAPQFAMTGLSLSGSIFPLRDGAEYRAERTLRNIDNEQFSMFMSGGCRVVGQRPATEIHASLPGIAWVMKCTNMSAMRGQQGKQYPASEDYFIEALGIPLSMIGQLESLGGRFIVPGAGTQIQIGGLQTTYSRYDISL
ncbi:MAG: hypothetical protein KIT42_06565 [Rhodocyclaceae bacterium]|nr:hypothetical protein [Rhodocyclaceae bacterium]